MTEIWVPNCSCYDWGKGIAQSDIRAEECDEKL